MLEQLMAQMTEVAICFGQLSFSGPVPREPRADARWLWVGLLAAPGPPASGRVWAGAADSQKDIGLRRWDLNQNLWSQYKLIWMNLMIGIAITAARGWQQQSQAPAEHLNTQIIKLSCDLYIPGQIHMETTKHTG